MLTFAPKGIQLDFVWLAKVFLLLSETTVDLQNARAVNFLWKPSKNMSQMVFFKM